jgi:hypothetical protein
MDLRQQEVRDLLRDIDTRRQDRVETWVHWGSVALGIGLAIALIWLVPPISLIIPFLPRFMNVILIMAGLAFGSFVLFSRLIRARPRFPFVGDASTELAQPQPDKQ